MELEKIASFTINHERLLRGIYVSRKDKIKNETVTTFDIRMKEPNREPVIDNPALHTIEHLGATFLRSSKEWKERVIYFGPMGCRTGVYLLLAGDLDSKDIVELVTDMFKFISSYNDVIPGTCAHDCGNFQDQNLDMAKWESDKYLKEVLNRLEEKNLVYPV